MTNTEKRLEEFDERFVLDFDGKPCFSISEIKSFLAESIHQAEQEMLKKLVGLYGSPMCHHLNHNKKQEHEGYEMCPVVTEISDLLTFLKDTPAL